MKHITCIEDLRQVHMRKVPKAFFDYADRGSYAEETLRANRDDLQQIKFRQRILVDISKRDLSTTILGETAALPLILAPVGSDRHAIRRRRNSRLPRRAGRRNSLHAEHDVDLLDRGRRRQCRQAVLVPALRHEGSRFHQGADRARHRRQVQRAGADRRPAGDRAAPCGHQERHDGAAGMDAVEAVSISPPSRPGCPACCAASAAPSAISSATSRAPRTSPRCRDLDRLAVRHHAELEGRRLDPQHLAGQAGPQGHSRRRGCRGSGQDRRAGAGGLQPWRPPARRRAVVDRGVAGDRRCRRLADGDACSTAAFARART